MRNPGGAARIFALCNSHFAIQINILHGIDQLHAVGHRFLKRFAAKDQPMPPARLLITAVRTASARSVSPPAAPPELISPARPI